MTISTEFTFDIWDMLLSDEDLAFLMSQMGDEQEAGTWEDLDSTPSPW